MAKRLRGKNCIGSLANGIQDKRYSKGIPMRIHLWPWCLFTAALIFLTGCQSAAKTASADGAPPLRRFRSSRFKPVDVPVYNDYTAQTYARDLVEVRGRVNGFIEKRPFQIGSDVEIGQVLYVLDQRPYEAEVSRNKGLVAQARANLEFAQRQVALMQAEADLAQAQANLVKAKQDVDRLTPLVKQDAAPVQDLMRPRRRCKPIRPL